MKPILICLALSLALAYASRQVYIRFERQAFDVCVELHPELADQPALCQAIHGERR